MSRDTHHNHALSQRDDLKQRQLLVLFCFGYLDFCFFVQTKERAKNVNVGLRIGSSEMSGTEGAATLAVRY